MTTPNNSQTPENTTPPAAGKRYIHRAIVACTRKGAYINAGDTITTNSEKSPPHFELAGREK
jgi:hypothetical protein